MGRLFSALLNSRETEPPDHFTRLAQRRERIAIQCHFNATSIANGQHKMTACFPLHLLIWTQQHVFRFFSINHNPQPRLLHGVYT